MKVLKFLLILIGIILAVGIIAGLVLPKSFLVERSIEIDAPKDVIFDQLVHVKKQEKWSPWEKLDPDMKHEYVGEDGTVGFISKWEGNKEVGKGEQEIKAIKVNERVDTELRFFEPREDKGMGYYTMTDGEKGTKVTWGMTGPSPFPGNVFLALMNIDKVLGDNFEKGLADLKTICLEEAKNASAKKYEIQKAKVNGKTYIGFREDVNMKDITAFYTKHFGAISGVMTTKKVEMAGMPSGLFYSWDEKTQMTNMAAAIPVAKSVKMDKGYQTIQLPAGEALVVDYYGPYEGSIAAHNAIDEYMKANNLKNKFPVVEEYITDPGVETDPAKWLTKVTYYLEKG